MNEYTTHACPDCGHVHLPKSKETVAPLSRRLSAVARTRSRLAELVRRSMFLSGD